MYKSALNVLGEDENRIQIWRPTRWKSAANKVQSNFMWKSAFTCLKNMPKCEPLCLKSLPKHTNFATFAKKNQISRKITLQKICLSQKSALHKIRVSTKFGLPQNLLFHQIRCSKHGWMMRKQWGGPPLIGVNLPLLLEPTPTPKIKWGLNN